MEIGKKREFEDLFDAVSKFTAWISTISRRVDILEVRVEQLEKENCKLRCELERRKKDDGNTST